MNAMAPTISETVKAVASREMSCVEVVRASLKRLDEVNADLNAFLQVFHERSLARAAELDAGLADGGVATPSLLGVPVALKDNICTDFGRTTCGSRMLEKYESPFAATAVAKLINAGAIVVGKTNLDEFAMGGSGENSAFGATRNPHDLSRVPGGSSSGSAAAVAAGVVPLALGSDTGGSIRQPAAFCGLVGVKPTYGRVSRHGLVAFASSLDQIGTLTRTVRDAAIALSAICGLDPLDATSTDKPLPDLLVQLDEPIHWLKVGVPRQARSEANHPAVAAMFEDAVRRLAGIGATIVDIDLPMIDHGVAAYYIVAPAEASSNLARFDGIRYGRQATPAPGTADALTELYCRSRSEGFGPEVQRRIMLGTHVLSSGYYDAYYTTALKVRRRLKADYDAAFAAGCHAVLTPTTPGPAFKIGEKSGDPLAMYLEDVYTVGVNLAGLPGVSVPAGDVAIEGKHLPLGVQFVGPAFEEAMLLRVARMFERAG